MKHRHPGKYRSRTPKGRVTYKRRPLHKKPKRRYKQFIEMIPDDISLTDWDDEENRKLREKIQRLVDKEPKVLKPKRRLKVQLMKEGYPSRIEEAELDASEKLDVILHQKDNIKEQIWDLNEQRQELSSSLLDVSVGTLKGKGRAGDIVKESKGVLKQIEDGLQDIDKDIGSAEGKLTLLGDEERKLKQFIESEEIVKAAEMEMLPLRQRRRWDKIEAKRKAKEASLPIFP